MIFKTLPLIFVTRSLFIQTWVCAVNKAARIQKNAEVQPDAALVPSVPVAKHMHVVSVDPGRNDTVVVLEGRDARLSFRSNCGNKHKELAFYTRKPPSYFRRVVLVRKLTGYESITNRYLGRLSVMAAGVNSHLLVISNVTLNDTNTYGVQVTCSLFNRRVHYQEITLVVKSLSKGNVSVSRPMFVKQPRSVSFSSRAHQHITCKAKFAHWLFWHCESIPHFRFRVSRFRKTGTLVARLRLHKKPLLGRKASCYCQAIGRGAVIQYSRMVRVEWRQASHLGWSSWSEWGACSSTCGNGTQISRRRCLNDSIHAKTTQQSSFLTKPCELIREKPCWSPCDENSVSLACPQEVRATNLTVEELVHRQWNITPDLSHNSSNLKFTITVSHGAFNLSKSLAVQSSGFSSPDIVLKGEWKGTEIKYSIGNVKSGNYHPEEPHNTEPKPVICTIPTSSKAYSITFTARIARRQQTACTFFATVHAPTKEETANKKESKSKSLQVFIGISVTLTILAVVLITGVARKSSLCKKKVPSLNQTVLSIHDVMIEPRYEPRLTEHNTYASLSQVNERTCNCFTDASGTFEVEPSNYNWCREISSKNRENFYYPCFSSRLNPDCNDLCGNTSFVPEMGNPSLHNAETLSEFSLRFDNDITTGYCSVSDASSSAPRLTRGRSVHSQTSFVSFGPSEMFNPDTDLPSSADPRYCDYGWVDHQGGRLAIKNTGVSLHIPRYAIPHGKRKIIYIALQKAGEDNPPLEGKGALLSPIVICGPDGMQFEKQVFLTMPHCADVTDESSWNMEVRSKKDEPGSVSEWKTQSSSKGIEYCDTYCKVEPKECILMLDHFTRFCVVGRPKTSPSNSRETHTQRKEQQQPKSDTPTEGAVGGIGCQKDAKDKKADERRQKESKKFEKEDKKENHAYKFVAIVVYSSPPSVDKDCAVRVYCIPNLDASLKRLDDLETNRYNGQISDAGHRVLKFDGSGENLLITDVEQCNGWKLSQGSEQVQEILFDIVWKGEELDLPPNVCFLYLRVNKDVYHFRSKYEARQDKYGAKAVRLHANSSIEKRNPSSSGYCSTKDADPIKYHLPVAVRRRLCILLDPREELISYWPDLAEKLGCDQAFIRYLNRGLGRDTSPTDKLLELWESTKSEEIPLDKLKQILHEMGRDDCAEVITYDVPTCDKGACSVHVQLNEH